MRKHWTIMLIALVSSVALAAQADAQRWGRGWGRGWYGPPYRNYEYDRPGYYWDGYAGPRPRPFSNAVPYIGGTWYMAGDRYLPCQIVQKGVDGRALFINERGDSAWGTVQGDTVLVPDWSDGRSPGLSGRIQGNQIIWGNGSFWIR